MYGGGPKKNGSTRREGPKSIQKHDSPGGVRKGPGDRQGMHAIGVIHCIGGAWGVSEKAKTLKKKNEKQAVRMLWGEGAGLFKPRF